MNDNRHNSSNKDFFQELSVEFLIHELKDPIAVIETGARTLLDKQDNFGSLSPRQEKTMKRIIRNARKAREMLYSLLEVGRSEAGSFACNRFNAVQTTFHVLADCLEVHDPALTEEMHAQADLAQALAHLRAHGITMTAALDLLELNMHQDQVKYRQIVGNLVKNALHFRREQIQISMNSHHQSLVVAVIDDGPGIEPEDCESIFERYSQANECAVNTRQGHGLGLAGARIMARCLGGDIELTCSKTEGTIFTLTLPMELGIH